MGMILINVVVRASVDSCHSIHVCPLFPALHLFCQVLAMDRYPEHLVEASVGDACTLMASIAWFPAQWTWANNNIEHVNRHNGLWYDLIKEHSSLPDSSSVPSFVVCLHFRNSFFVFYFLNFWERMLKNVERRMSNGPRFQAHGKHFVSGVEFHFQRGLLVGVRASEKDPRAESSDSTKDASASTEVHHFACGSWPFDLLGRQCLHLRKCEV